MSQIGNELRQWAKTNDFYENGILSNGLKLNRLAAERIRRTIVELEYHARDRLAKRLETEFSEIVEKCHSLDMARIKGCFTEDEYLLLDLKRRKIIGAVFEIAELVEMVNSLKDFNKVSADTELPAGKDEWISFAAAADILGMCKGTVSRWVNQGKLNANGLEGQKRKVSKTQVLILKQQIEEKELMKDVEELRADSRKYS